MKAKESTYDHKSCEKCVKNNYEKENEKKKFQKNNEKKNLSKN